MAFFSDHHERQLDRIEADQRIIISLLERILIQMSALTDAVTAQATVAQAAVDAASAAVAKINAGSTPSDSAEVAQAVTDITANTAKFQTAIDALNGAQAPA